MDTMPDGSRPTPEQAAIAREIIAKFEAGGALKLPRAEPSTAGEWQWEEPEQRG